MIIIKNIFFNIVKRLLQMQIFECYGVKTQLYSTFIPDILNPNGYLKIFKVVKLANYMYKLKCYIINNLNYINFKT